MTDALTVTPWRRYGKYRLYVATTDGVPLGWHDMHSGQTHVTAMSDRDRVLRAVAAWQQTTAAAAGSDTVRHAATSDDPVTVIGSPEPAQQVPAPTVREEYTTNNDGYQDLAGRRAGAEARAQADALRHAAPVRTFLTRMLGVHTEERAWRKGAEGEEKVATQLAKLIKRDPRWRVINAIPVGVRGSDIDHLVIGPGGVYSLNAKHHRGAKIWIGGNTFMVNGQYQPYVHNSRYEAQRASKLLTAATGHPVPVTGVIVPVGAHSFVIKRPPAEVKIVDRSAVVEWLLRRPETLDVPIIDAIYQIARQPTTWRTGRT